MVGQLARRVGPVTRGLRVPDGVHDLAVKLGAGCPFSDPQAVPDVLNGVGNRSADPAAVETKSSPSESAEPESAAADEESAAADEESAEDLALSGKSLAITLGLIDLS